MAQRDRVPVTFGERARGVDEQELLRLVGGLRVELGEVWDAGVRHRVEDDDRCARGAHWLQCADDHLAVDRA